MHGHHSVSAGEVTHAAFLHGERRHRCTVHESLVVQALVIQQQQETIALLEGGLQALEGEKAKNSRNSNKPPSSDGRRSTAPFGVQASASESASVQR